MIRIKKGILPCLLAALILAAPVAHAQPKPWIFSWWPGHWIDQDFIPFLEDGKRPHNSQWDDSLWRPEHWIAQRQDATELMQDFYRTDIIRGQYTRHGVRVLEVGPGFYRLGGEDKRRVTETVDFVHGITADDPLGVFMLRDWRSKKTIGTYTQYGLQLQ